MNRRRWIGRAAGAAVGLWALAAAAPAPAQFMTGRGLAPAVENPADALSAQRIIDTVGFDQRLGAQLPLDLPVIDEDGRGHRLGEFFGERPVVLGLVYYRCPVLCGLVERGTAMAARPLDLAPGEDYEVVFVSFDATDTPERASETRRRTVEAYGGKESSTRGWHFLTADQASIDTLLETVGFRVVREEATGQFAHAAGIMVATPDGRLSRYLYGAEFAPRDLKLALVESSAGKMASWWVPVFSRVPVAVPPWAPASHPCSWWAPCGARRSLSSAAPLIPARAASCSPACSFR